MRGEFIDAETRLGEEDPLAPIGETRAGDLSTCRDRCRSRYTDCGYLDLARGNRGSLPSADGCASAKPSPPTEFGGKAPIARAAPARANRRGLLSGGGALKIDGEMRYFVSIDPDAKCADRKGARRPKFPPQVDTHSHFRRRVEAYRYCFPNSIDQSWAPYV